MAVDDEQRSGRIVSRAPNQPISDRFSEAADLLEQQGANPFRVRAYREAAQTVASLPEDLRVSIVGTFGTPRGRAGPIGRQSARPACPAWLRPDCRECAGPMSGAVGPPAVGEPPPAGQRAQRLA